MMSSAPCVGGVPVTVAGRKSSSLIFRPQPSHALIASAPRQLAQRRFNVVATASDDADSGSLSGEWPVTLALASYELLGVLCVPATSLMHKCLVSIRVSCAQDVGQYFQDNVFKEEAPPGSLLQDIMSTDLSVTTPEASLAELKEEFGAVSGLPVVKDRKSMVLVGVVSRKDLLKAGGTVAEIMSTPPVAARPDSKVADAACLMLKHKVHRIPIVDYKTKVVGIVTRTDIFTALALNSNA